MNFVIAAKAANSLQNNTAGSLNVTSSTPVVVNGPGVSTQAVTLQAGNCTVSSSTTGNIILTPSTGKYTVTPRLALGNETNYLSSNQNGLTLHSTQDITLDTRLVLPGGSTVTSLNGTITLGSTTAVSIGSGTISGNNTAGNLLLTTTNNVYTRNMEVNEKLLVNADLQFSPTAKLSLGATGQVSASSTLDSTSSTSASLVLAGGLGVAKNLHSTGRIVQKVGSTSALLVSNTSGNTVFEVDTVNAKVNLNNSTITGLGDPVQATDAANKRYVDALSQGMSVKDSVDVATTAPLTLNSPGTVIDTVTLEDGFRVLVKNQTDPTQNGVYILASGALVRTTDFDVGIEPEGFFTLVPKGFVNASLGFVCVSPGVVGTDPVSFTQFTALGRVEAGDALSKNNNTLNVNVDTASIEVVGDALRVSAQLAGQGLIGGGGTPLETDSDQSHVTSLGTLTTGVWNASTLSVPYGGTGTTFFTAGSLTFGNGTGSLDTSTDLVFNKVSGYLGIGTVPQSELHVEGTLTLQTGLDTVELTSSGLTTSTQFTLNELSLNVDGSVTIPELHSTTVTSGSFNVGTGTMSSLTVTGQASVDTLLVDGTLLESVSGTLTTANFQATRLTSTDRLEHSSNGLFKSLVNPTLMYKWFYLGENDDISLELESIGLVGDNGVYTHTFKSTRPDCRVVVYTGSQVFAYLAPESVASLCVYSAQNSVPCTDQGTGSVPTLWQSGWTVVHDTASDPNGVISVGPLTSTDFTTSAHIVKTSFNYNKPASTLSGVVIQQSGDDLVADYTGVLGDQSGADPYQLVLDTDADGPYTGWMVSINSEYRLVTAYNAGSRVVTLDEPFTSPGVQGDPVSLFNKVVTSVYYNPDTESFVSGYATIESGVLVPRGKCSFDTLDIICRDINGIDITLTGQLESGTLITTEVGTGTTSLAQGLLDFTGYRLTGDSNGLELGTSSVNVLELSTAATTLASTSLTLTTDDLTLDTSQVTLSPGCVLSSQTGTVSLNNLTIGQSGATVGSLNVTSDLEVLGLTTIVDTTESGSVTQGALVVSGGVGVGKDVYIGGDLYVSGSTFVDVVEAVTMTFQGLINNTLVTGFNSRLLRVAQDEYLLTFVAELEPTAESTETKFEFSLPYRTTVLTRTDTVCTSSGFRGTDAGLFNVLCNNVVGTNRCRVTFHAADVDVHTLQVSVRYIAV